MINGVLGGVLISELTDEGMGGTDAEPLPRVKI